MSCITDMPVICCNRNRDSEWSAKVQKSVNFLWHTWQGQQDVRCHSLYAWHVRLLWRVLRGGGLGVRVCREPEPPRTRSGSCSIMHSPRDPRLDALLGRLCFQLYFGCDLFVRSNVAEARSEVFANVPPRPEAAARVARAELPRELVGGLSIIGPAKPPRFFSFFFKY